MLLKPVAPPYDALAWRKLPFPERARLVCQAWAVQGFGSAHIVYAFYALKIVFYVGLWVYFCSLTPGLVSGASLAWVLQPIAFQKAIGWSLLFEVLGLGCGSGPLTGRIIPPIGGFLYFLRPKTTKLPLFEGAPLIGAQTRGLLDVAAYLALLVFAVLALVNPAPGPAQWLPVVVLVAVLGVLDRTIFLAARGEHYWVTLVVFTFAPHWIAGAQVVQLALWFFAGVSKLTDHFPSVICVMTSNSPFTTPFPAYRKSMYRHYPDDLCPSTQARLETELGVALEIGTALVMLAGVLLASPALLAIGLVMMVLLHGFILSNVPMGVPIEWQFIMLYAGFFLFGAHGNVTPLQLDSIPVAIFLAVFCGLIPILGNLKPEWISFLMAMRYYAGNWATSIWLFEGESYRKLARLTKSSPWLPDQVDQMYGRELSVGYLGKIEAFRLMHLHGRALQQLVPQAVDALENYEWVEGELVAGLALGWNFGDGHLHNEQLLRAIQAQCGFAEGELRVIMLEAQPWGKPTLAYRIHDACSGPRAAGAINVRELLDLQPWPTAH